MHPRPALQPRSTRLAGQGRVRQSTIVVEEVEGDLSGMV